MLSINFSIVLVLLISVTNSFGRTEKVSNQNEFNTKRKKIKLVSWKAIDCDHTYDPNRLVNRITSQEVRNGHTFITVSFSDNCCAKFNPSMQFKDAKLLLTSNNNSGEFCSCDCCFSIEFEIENIPESEYSVYFNGEKIERSDNHYKVFEPSQVEYKGNIINKRNKYGFNEGTWINFYENGDIKEISEYPNHTIYFEPDPLWTKEFHSSGSLLFFKRKDTTESWFEDGQLRHQYIEYKKGDTTYLYKFRQYENHQLELKELKKNYPTVFLSEFDPDYKGEGTRNETVYQEEYFRNGKPAFIHRKDTSYSWHENGKIESKQYKNGKISYDWDGFVTSKIYHWKEKGPKLWGDLDHSLFVDYNTDRKVSKIRYRRDEANEIGISTGLYDWEWGDNLKLIESPQKWQEDFPWKRFKEIEIE